MTKLTKAQLARDVEVLTLELGFALQDNIRLRSEVHAANSEIDHLNDMLAERDAEREFVSHVIQDLDPSEDRE